jgi:hypothetical protein
VTISRAEDRKGKAKEKTVSEPEKENSGYGFNKAVYEKADIGRFDTAHYKPGKYETVVVLFEGKVVCSPYDNKGLKPDRQAVLLPGDSATQLTRIS